MKNHFWKIIVILTMCAVLLASLNIIELEKRVDSLTQIVSIMETRIDALEQTEIKLWINHNPTTINIQKMNSEGHPKTVYFHRLTGIDYNHSEWISMKWR